MMPSFVGALCSGCARITIAFTLALAPLAAAAACTKTVMIEQDEDPLSVDVTEPTPERPDPDRSDAEASRPRDAGGEASDFGACEAKPSRDDCIACCDVVSPGAACRARCEGKPPADDCRSVPCEGDEVCSNCWSRWECLPRDRRC